MRALFYLAVSAVLSGAGAMATERSPPAASFDLGRWKLQIPGPKDVRDLRAYASDYFHLGDAGEMWFHLDASEKGTTPGAKYVRSELRHLPEWGVDETRRLSAEFRVVSALMPDKVTTMQIHGIAPGGSNAPPLLRIAVNAGDLVAALMTDSSGKKNETIPLVKQLGARFVKVDVVVRAGHLSIAVDGQPKLSRSLVYWTHRNYFKAGCYPQATHGTVDIVFRSLTAD